MYKLLSILNCGNKTLKQILEKYPHLEKSLESITEDFFEDGKEYGKNDKPHLVGEPAPINESMDFLEIWNKRKK